MSLKDFGVSWASAWWVQGVMRQFMLTLNKWECDCCAGSWHTGSSSFSSVVWTWRDYWSGRRNWTWRRLRLKPWKNRPSPSLVKKKHGRGQPRRPSQRRAVGLKVSRQSKTLPYLYITTKLEFREEKVLPSPGSKFVNNPVMIRPLRYELPVKAAGHFLDYWNTITCVKSKKIASTKSGLSPEGIVTAVLGTYFSLAVLMLIWFRF